MYFEDVKKDEPVRGYTADVRHGFLQRALPLIVLFCMTLIPLPASAYWDPGVGSILWQMIAALLLGAVYTMKVYWYRLKSFFSGKKPEPK
jgi:hypothetical protein